MLLNEDVLNRFRKHWHTGHVVLPVIHASSMNQVLQNVAIAVEAEAHGVFLINHSISVSSLFSYHDTVQDRFPGLWVGLNCLDINPTWACEHPADGTWSDNAGIFEGKEKQPYADPRRIMMRSTGWEGMYFGGVAFKGQRKVRPEHYGLAAQKAMPCMDVVTTSGPGTGYAADVDKIRIMKEAIGDFPLAIASGITPDNVGDYLPHADCFLVASGISDDFENLNLGLTKRLMSAVWEYDGLP